MPYAIWVVFWKLNINSNVVRLKFGLLSVAVLGRAGGGAQAPNFAPDPSSFVATYYFLAKITQNLISLRYQILEKCANLQLPLNAPKPKVLQLQLGGLCP